jgi:N-carbamoylputrescine amidase
MTQLTVAATQMACGHDRDENIARAEKLVHAAAERGAGVILLQELFETPYFCKDTEPELMHLAVPVSDNPAVQHFCSISAKYEAVLPISIYERANNAQYNSLVMIDNGEILGVYRKSHIPDGPGYREKYYFSPGDTGFHVWNTRRGRVGAAICWDQWFPETARILTLKGADVVLYPTAIGSEPHDETIHSRDHWQRTMQGHSAANLVPIVASNRIGREEGRSHGNIRHRAEQAATRELGRVPRPPAGALWRYPDAGRHAAALTPPPRQPMAAGSGRRGSLYRAEAEMRCREIGLLRLARARPVAKAI